MQVDFAVFKFFERVNNSEFILFDNAEEKICLVSDIMLLSDDVLSH